MMTPPPVATSKRILVVLTACVLQLTCIFVFAADNSVSAERYALKVVAGTTPARGMSATLQVPEGGMA